MAPARLGQDGLSPTFGDQLRRLRLRGGLSQEALAERAGLSTAAIGALEQGLRRSPYPQTLAVLASAMFLSAEERVTFAEAARLAGVVRDSSGPVFEEGPSRGLPRLLTSFVGREQELVDLEHLLEQAPLVTLIGAGGIGKTRLALELGNQLKNRYVDGVWLVDLSPVTDSRLVVATLAAAVGVREQARIRLVRTVSDALRTRQLLIILDNCEHLIQTCAELVKLLLGTCPELTILATSREPLAVAGEVVWSVPPLGQPDPHTHSSPETVLEHAAGRLFVDRVQAAQPSFVLDERTAPVVADISRRLDGIPLALELAATRVRAFGLIGLAERLDDRLRLLVGGRTALPRQQTLRATLDWSYELLGEPERRLFARLAPFAGGWTLADAEAVCTSEELMKAEVAERLANLVDQSMVVVDPRPGSVRYRLLETMRQYAAERLSEFGQGGAGYRRHRDHYLALAERLPAERFDPGQLDWLAEEADNIRVALRWSIDQDEFEAGLRLADAAHGLWYVRGSLTEGRAWLTELLDRAGPAAETALGGKSLGTIARLAFVQGDLATAARLADRSFQLAERLGDPRGLALVGVRRAVVARGQGNLERARGLYQEALDRSRALADRDVQIFSLYGLSMTLLELDDRDMAETLAQECVDIAEPIGHLWGLASAHRVLGHAAASRGSAHLARTHFEDCLFLSRRLGYAQGVVYALTALGQLSVVESGTAQNLLCEALELAHELGDRLEVLHCLEGLSQIAGSRAHPEQAVRLAGAAAALRDALGATPYPREQEELVSWLQQARHALGEARFSERWIEGRTLKLDQLIAEVLTQQLETASHGEASVAADVRGLTEREIEVARLVGRGLSTREIAEGLAIAEGTAKVHVGRILGKLELHSRAQLAVWAVQRGLVSAHT